MGNVLFVSVIIVEGIHAQPDYEPQSYWFKMFEQSHFCVLGETVYEDVISINIPKIAICLIIL